MRIVLCRPSHPGNIGAAARALKVMGLRELSLVAPAQHPSTEATHRATGAVDVLERAPVHPDLSAAVADCVFVVGVSARARHEGPESMDIADAARLAVAREAEGPVAFVFGNERSGLENSEVAACHVLAWIPTGPELSSLNLASAVQVVSYELLRARQGTPEPAPVHPDDRPVTRGEVDKYVEHLWTNLVAFGAIHPEDPKLRHLRGRIQRMLARAQPRKAELRAAYGLVRWVDRIVNGIRPREGKPRAEPQD